MKYEIICRQYAGAIIYLLILCKSFHIIIFVQALDMDRNQQGYGEEDKIQELWECPACTFKNHPTIHECQICAAKKPGDDTVISIQKKQTGGIVCHECKQQLETLQKVCPHCKTTLIPESQQQQEQAHSKIKKEDKKTISKNKMVACRSCGQQNDSQNTQCVFCQTSLKEQLIPIKKRAPKKPRSYSRAYGYAPAGYSTAACRYCRINAFGMTLQEHEQTCPHISEDALETRYLEIEKNHCMYCYEKFDSSQFETHMKACSTYKEFYKRDGPTYERCTRLQIDTMIYMHEKSEKLHWIAQQLLLKRIDKIGQKANDLQNLHHYILNYAPIIIHMHANRHMQFFIKDTHYRNQFETKKSSGSLSQTSRINWQDRMFDKKHHNATPFERVKYGTINFTNDPKGVRACVSYGQSYFLLKPHVRNRCTVTDMDSSSPSATIATFQSCYHLLNKLPEAELKAAFEGSKANEVASNVIGSYKQIQIHGPIQFKKDIERVYINKAQLADPNILKMVKQFCKNNDLQYEIFGEQLPKPGTGFGGTGLFTFGTSYVMPPPVAVAPTLTYPSPLFAPMFAPPVPSASTAHLFFAPRRSTLPTFPAATGVRTVIQQKQEKEPQQGVDYI